MAINVKWSTYLYVYIYIHTVSHGLVCESDVKEWHKCQAEYAPWLSPCDVNSHKVKGEIMWKI